MTSMFLISDLLLFVLAGTLLCFAVWVSLDTHRFTQWVLLLRSRVAAVSLIILLFFFMVALLDSMRFRVDDPNTQRSETVTVLDQLLYHHRVQVEKTYSAPFGRQSFSKETLLDEHGQSYRDYPPLLYGGQHLAEGESVGKDLVGRSFIGLFKGAVFGCFILLPWVVFRFVLTTLAVRIDKEAVPSVDRPSRQIMIATWIVLWSLAGVIQYVGQVYHILGTDKVGYDVLFQSIKAIRTAILIGTFATLLTLPLAIVLGVCAGYFRGWVDDVVQFIYTTLNSIPGVLLIAASVLLLDVYIENHADQFQTTLERADFKFLALCFILGITSWTGLCRLIRAETLKLSQLDFVRAARLLNAPHWVILFRHLLPNLVPLILIVLVLDFSVFILAEAVLSYIGVGVDPSMASWGNMINAARSELARDPVVWWPLLASFVLMFKLVLAVNLFADRVRDVLDPNQASAHQG